MPHLILSLLGPFACAFDDQPVTDFRTDTTRALLAYLAMQAGQPFSREHLGALLSPTGFPEDGMGNLRTTLYRLKQALGEQAAAYLEIGKDQVCFRPQAGFRLDAREFQELAQAVQEHTHRRAVTCPLCLPRLQQMARLYRGNFLEDLRLELPLLNNWRVNQAGLLQQPILPALSELGERALATQHYNLAEAYLSRLLRLTPWSEAAHRQMMRALALNNKRSAALAQYEACRQILQQTFAAGPDPETQRLVQQIRSGASLENPAAQVRCLPAPVYTLVGRETELAQLIEWLADRQVRAVTVFGPEGVGKTRLALEAAWEVVESFEHGACWLDLPPEGEGRAPELDENQLVWRLALALNLRSAYRSPQQQVLDYLRPKEFLLVLDGVTALSAAGLQFLKRLLTYCPNLSLLITGPQPLELPHEKALPLGGLKAEEFQALFLEQARRQGITPAPGPGLQEALQKAHADTGGLPLAALLLGSWTAVLTQPALERLLQQDSLGLLAEGRAPHQPAGGLRPAFERTWGLLSPAEQRALASLSLCQGEIEAPAARAITGQAPGVLEGLRARALLQRLSATADQMMPLVRRFAAEKRRQESWPPGPTSPAEAPGRHAAYFLGLLQEAQPALFGAAPSQALERLRRFWQDLRQAWLWAAQNDPHFDLPGQLLILRRLCRTAGLTEAGLQLLQETLAAVEAGPERARRTAWLLMAQTDLLAQQGELELALQRCLEAADLAAEVNDPTLNIQHTLCLAGLSLERGAHRTARRQVEALLAEQPALPAEAQARALVLLGRSLLALGQNGPAEACFERARRLFQQLGDALGQIFVLRFLGQLCRRGGRLQQALEYGEEQLALARRWEDPLAECEALLGLGEARTAVGQAAAAQGLLEQALQLSQQTGDILTQSRCLAALGRLAQQEGDLTNAFGYLQSALENLQEQPQLPLAMEIRLDLGELALQVGDLALAGKMLNTALRHFLSGEQGAAIARALVGLAQVELSAGNPATADEHLQAARPFLLAEDESSLAIPLGTLWQAARAWEQLGQYVAAGQAQQRLLERLEQLRQNLKDPDLQRSLLENIPLHRRLQMLRA